MLVDMFAVKALRCIYGIDQMPWVITSRFANPIFLCQLSSSRREFLACPLRLQQMILGVTVDCHEQYPARTTKRRAQNGMPLAMRTYPL